MCNADSGAQTHFQSMNVDFSVAEKVQLRKTMMVDAKKSILVQINSIADKCWPILLFFIIDFTNSARNFEKVFE